MLATRLSALRNWRIVEEAQVHFGFEGWIWVLIASVPHLCIRFTFHIMVAGYIFVIL